MKKTYIAPAATRLEFYTEAIANLAIQSNNPYNQEDDAWTRVQSPWSGWYDGAPWDETAD